MLLAFSWHHNSFNLPPYHIVVVCLASQQLLTVIVRLPMEPTQRELGEAQPRKGLPGRQLQRILMLLPHAGTSYVNDTGCV